MHTRPLCTAILATVLFLLLLLLLHSPVPISARAETSGLDVAIEVERGLVVVGGLARLAAATGYARPCRAPRARRRRLGRTRRIRRALRTCSVRRRAPKTRTRPVLLRA